MDEINGLLKRMEAYEKEREEREEGLGLYTTNNNLDVTYGMYTDTVNKSYGVYGSTSSWTVGVEPTIMERIEPVKTKEREPYVANAQKMCNVRVKVFPRKEYTSSTSFEDDINDFLDYLHDNNLKGSLTMHADVVYIAYESNR